MYRVEDKYCLSELEQFVMRQRLEAIMHSDSNEKDKAGYKISSLYFDDYMDTHYYDALNGNPYRFKYRIRIYNDSLEKITAEIKIKQYSRIKKLQQRITLENLQAWMNGETIPSSSEDADNPVNMFNNAIKDKLLKPKVIVTYDRKAFICNSGNVRITFDTGLRGSNDVERFGYENLSYDISREGDSVLEVKYDSFLPDYIAQTLEINQMWQTSFSKYRICREMYQ